jgi:hypothetical protein
MIVLLIIFLLMTNIIFSVQSVKAHLNYDKNYAKLVGFKEQEKKLFFLNKILGEL